MGQFVYTLDVPTENPEENKRLGYRVPRTVLLPPYLYQNPYFFEFAQSLDMVLGPAVDEKIEILGNLRNVWVTDPSLEQTILDEDMNPQLIPNEAWPRFERSIVVKQVNALGMNLRSAGLITDDQYQTISRWVGQYWFGKGTQSFINFINYCLSSTLTVRRLWTEDYVNFYPDGDSHIGQPIWEGGTWYPTSHVDIVASGGLQGIDPQSLIVLFYEISNYNLVLRGLDLQFTMNIVDHLEDGYVDAAVVAIGLWNQASVTMSNFARYGSSPPPTHDTSPAVTTNALVTPGASVLMAAPSAWVAIDGKKFPVYAPSDMSVSTGSDLPTTVMGGPSTNGQTGGYYVLYGPPQWINVPGSTYSPARIPAYTTQPQPKTVSLQQIPTSIIGKGRAFLLVNPAGWMDINNTGMLSPYWLDN